jgi:hypothetical protein
VKDGILEERRVKVVDRLDDHFIIEGYKEGETIVIESLVDVKPGQAVSLAP